MRLTFSLLTVFLALGGCARDAGDRRHLEWLAGRQVPNAAVPLPFPARRNLVLSYEMDTGSADYRYVHQKSFCYDNALAAIAFASHGRWDEARRILLALAPLAGRRHGFWFSYNATEDWPNEKDSDGALTRTGAAAWVGYAFCFFLENHPSLNKESPEFLHCLAAAETTAFYILSQQVDDTADPLRGLVRGGWGEVDLVPGDTGGVREEWRGGAVTWASTEHNIDAHLFLTHLYGLTGDGRYRSAADRMAESLLAKTWSETHGQFYRGIKADGKADTVLALDCASWASVFLRNIGEAEKADRCLLSITRRFSRDGGESRNFLPYHGTLIYEVPGINRKMFPENPEMRWGDFPFVWPEGNYGVALALLAAGQKERAAALFDAWDGAAGRDAPGGLPYASAAVPHQFSTWKSVSSTAWHLILSALLHENPFKKPFFS